MFCPTIKRECIGEKCRDWDASTQMCFTQSQRDKQDKLFEDLSRFYKEYSELAEGQKMSTVWVKLMVHQILRDPTIPQEVKDVINQALMAPSSEVAEKFLKEEGLIE